MKVGCLVVDDEALARVRLRDLIADVPWLECVGEADGGVSAVRALEALRPDLVFLDVELPGFSGIEVLEGSTYADTISSATLPGNSAFVANMNRSRIRESARNQR